MLYLLLLPFYIYYYSLSGVVRQADNLQPVSGATITLKGGSNRTVSDVRGKFTLESLPAGIQTLVISHIDYETKEIAISDFTESPLEVLLQKKGSAPQENPNTKPNNDRRPRPEPDEEKDRSDSIPPLVLSIDTTVGIEQVVIQAVRADERTPVTQTTLNRAAIEKIYAGQDMPMLLLQQPSMTAYSDNGTGNGYSYLRLRGIDPTRINMTLNGAPLNEPEDQGVYFSNFVDFGNSLESIQIQRGTGTSSNGTASFAGSINFETLNLARRKGGEVQASYGSFNTYRASASYATGLLPNRLAFYSRFSLFGTDGYRYHSNNRSYSFFMSGGYVGNKDLVKITAFSGVSNNQMAYLPTILSDIEADPRTNYLRSDERDQFTQHYVQAQYVHSFNERLDISATGFYSHIDGNYDIFVGDMLNLALRSHFAGGFMHVNYESKVVNLTVGAQGNYFQRSHEMSVKPFIDTLLYSNLGKKAEGSAFAKLRIDAGIASIYADVQGRYARFGYRPDWFSSIAVQPIDWWFFNPKLGLQLRVHPLLSLYASGGMTSREPTRTDLLGAYDNIDASNIAEVGDFSNVKPERVIDAELGLRMRTPKLYWQLNGYYMHFNNEIAAIGQLNLFGIPLRKNVARSYRAGAELEFNYQIVKGLSFSGSACYNYHRIVEYTTDYDSMTYQNVRPLLTPDWIANATLEYQPFDWWSFAVSGRYSSASFLDNTQNRDLMVPWYIVGDFRTTFRYRHHQLSVVLNNFTNARYYMSGSVFGGLPAYYVQAPINFLVTYSFKF